MTVSNNADTMTKWFVDDTRPQFDSFNAKIGSMAEKEIVGDKAKSNFLTARAKCTLIAVDALATAVFLFLQSFSQAIITTITQALQIDFKAAGNTAKENVIVSLKALKISISMIPLIVLGVLCPSAAYSKIAKKITDTTEAKKQANLAVANELADVKKELAQTLSIKPTDFDKLKPAEITAKVVEFGKAQDQKLLDIAAALKMTVADKKVPELADFQAAVDTARDKKAIDAQTLAAKTATDENTRLKETAATHQSEITALDTALCEATGVEIAELTQAERIEKITLLKTEKAKAERLNDELSTARNDLEILKATLETQKETLATLNSGKVSLEGTIAKLTSQLEAKKEADDGAGKEPDAIDQTARIAELAAQVSAFEKQIQEAKEEPTVVINDNPAQSQKIAKLEEDKAALEAEKTRVQLELTAANEKIAGTVGATGLDGDGKYDGTDPSTLGIDALKAVISALNEEDGRLQDQISKAEQLKQSLTTKHNAIMLIYSTAFDELNATLHDAKHTPKEQGERTVADMTQERVTHITAALKENAALEAMRKELDLVKNELQASQARNDYSTGLLRTWLTDPSGDQVLLGCQILAHPQGLPRTQVVVDFNPSDDLDTVNGTKLTWVALDESMATYIEEASGLMPEGDKPQLDFYRDVNQSIKDKKLAPIPTGIPYVNKLGDKSWAEGENLITVPSILFKTTGTEKVQAAVFKNENGHFVMPITYAEEFSTAANHALSKQFHLAQDFFEGSEETKLEQKLDCDNGIYTTDFSFIAHNATIHQFNGTNKVEELRKLALDRGLTLELIDENSPGRFDLVGNLHAEFASEIFKAQLVAVKERQPEVIVEDSDDSDNEEPPKLVTVGNVDESKVDPKTTKVVDEVVVVAAPPKVESENAGGVDESKVDPKPTKTGDDVVVDPPEVKSENADGSKVDPKSTKTADEVAEVVA